MIHIPLDVTDLSTITAAAEVIAAKFGVLDVLVNNAGINVPGDDLPSSASLEALDATWRTNFLGAVAVTCMLAPLDRYVLLFVPNLKPKIHLALVEAWAETPLTPADLQAMGIGALGLKPLFLTGITIKNGQNLKK